MARRALLLALACTLAGCGSSGSGGGSGAGEALAYLPSDAATILFVSTDVDGEQWERFDELVYRKLSDEDEQSFEEFAEGWAKEVGLSWEEDVKPLLGNDLAIAVGGENLPLLGGGESTTFLAALELAGGDIEEVLGKAEFTQQGEANGATLYSPKDDEEAVVALEDDVVVFAEDEDELRAALRRRDSGDGIDEARVEEELAGLPSDSFVRGFGPLEGLAEQDEFSRFADVPLVQALQTWALAARFGREDLTLDVAVRLNEDELDEADLPLVMGDDSPEIVIRERELSGGNLNQSQTTVFLLRALRAGYPDSRFVKAADAIEQELGIDFEEEILRQFNGPSASFVSPDGRMFAARSEVRDPDALREVLPKLAPHLPALVEGLQGLQSEGMALLFLFAPDAPAAAPMEGVKVDPPASEDGLYRISGLTGDGPAELHLGLIGDLFVVASSEQLAREIAEADTSEARGAEGAGVLRADLTQLRATAEAALPFPLGGEERVAWLEAGLEVLRARVRVELG